ncbi:MAG: transaldolase family protein [Pirellulales bacterium]|nr:transaldolase family protein [Pirellulales bacterium]
MAKDYFHRVAAETKTRVWVNNPSLSDMRNAMDAGAISCTTNPAYGSKLLKSEHDYMVGVIQSVVPDFSDDHQAADRIYQIISGRIMQEFLPLYESSGGREGFVTMQDDPRNDYAPEPIIGTTLRHAKVGANYMAKIPVIESGMAAMERLVELNIPICATEIFSIAQAVAMCELYAAASAKSGNAPPFYLTHITGIYDEEIQSQVAAQGIDISEDVVRQAGTIVMRKQYRVIKERGFATTMLGGGARAPYHFTEWVGGDAHITINYSTFEELFALDPLIVDRIHAEDDAAVIAELREKIPDFRRAYDDEGLAPHEFEKFEPLLRFRNNFIDGCDAVLREVANYRRAFTSA